MADSRRRRLRGRLWFWLDANADALADRMPRWEDRVYGVQAALERPLCLVLGHVPVQDHCGLPDHDHCAYCQSATPGQANRG